MKPETGKLYERLVRRILEKMNLTPDEALEKVKQEASMNRYDTYCDLINATATGFTERTRYNAIYALRSFLTKNGVMILPPTKLEQPERVKERTRLSWEDALAVCAAASKPYNLALKMMLHCGWGSGEFLKFNTAENWEQIRSTLAKMNGEEYVRIEMPKGRKRNRSPFYTLIPRALLQEVVDSKIPLPISTSHGYAMENGKRKNAINGVLLDMNHHHSSRLYLERAFTTALKRAPITVKGNGKPSPHELRDTFRTQAGHVKCEPDVANFAMGHEIDPYQYNKIYEDEKFMWTELKKIYGPQPALIGEVADENKALRQRMSDLEKDYKELRELFQNQVRSLGEAGEATGILPAALGVMEAAYRNDLSDQDLPQLRITRLLECNGFQVAENHNGRV